MRCEAREIARLNSMKASPTVSSRLVNARSSDCPIFACREVTHRGIAQFGVGHQTAPDRLDTRRWRSTIRSHMRHRGTCWRLPVVPQANVKIRVGRRGELQRRLNVAASQARNRSTTAARPADRSVMATSGLCGHPSNHDENRPGIRQDQRFHADRRCLRRLDHGLEFGRSVRCALTFWRYRGASKRRSACRPTVMLKSGFSSPRCTAAATSGRSQIRDLVEIGVDRLD